MFGIVQDLLLQRFGVWKLPLVAEGSRNSIRMCRGVEPASGSNRKVSIEISPLSPNVGRYPTFVMEGHIRLSSRSRVQVM